MDTKGMNVGTIDLGDGRVALVDEEDFEEIARHTWRPLWSGSAWYVARSAKTGGRWQNVFMHRVITHAPRGVQVDHRNGDGLDNRRENLRLASSQQNARNRKHRSDSRLPFKGITFDPRSRFRPWRARITVAGANTASRSFATAEEAAREYDRMARERFGVFARLNFTAGEGANLEPN